MRTVRSAAVIQAAGGGRRFSPDEYKLLTPVVGIPMILRTLTPVLETGFDEIVVVIGSHSDEMERILRDFPVKTVYNPIWETGQSTSLSAGVRAIRESSDRACLMLGDQPFLRKETLIQLLEESDAHPEEIIVPFFEEKRGNPIILPSLYYEKLLELTQGDTGGKQLLRSVGYRSVKSSDPGVIHDIDTQEDLKRNE